MKSPLCFLCFAMIFLSSACWIVSVHAASKTSPCTSYYTAYQSVVDAYNTALEKMQRIQVAIAKVLPGQSVPDELKHLEDEYDSDPTGFYKTLEGMGVSLPGWISGPLSDTQKLARKPVAQPKKEINDVTEEHLDTDSDCLASCDRCRSVL